MPQPRADLQPFFSPRALAVVGSVDRTAAADDLRRSLQLRFGAPCHLVNPKGGSVGDIVVHTSVADVPDEVDVAVLDVPTAAVAEVVDECGRRGIRHVLAQTVGFAELDEEGVRHEHELEEVVRRWDIRLIGPNTSINVFEQMPELPPHQGAKIALISQSGHMLRPVQQAWELGVRFSRWVATGNEVGLDAADFIEYFAHDDDTGVIACYLEGFRDGDRLRRAFAAAREQGKPVVVLKIGKSEEGARMARTHTAHLTGSDAVVDAVFRRYGVTRVDDLDELLETAAMFAKVGAVAGDGVCCYSISGGSSVLMAEHAGRNGIRLPPLAAETQEALHEVVPPYLSVANPVDNGGLTFHRQDPAGRRRAFELITRDPAVDVHVYAIHTPQGWMNERFVDDLVSFRASCPKPVVTVWPSPKVDVPELRQLLDSGLPVFRSYRSCFRSLRALFDVRLATVAPGPAAPSVPSVPAQLAEAGEGPLPTPLAAAMLRRFGVPLADEELAISEGQAVEAARRIGFPVVLKPASEAVAHRSDHGLVAMDLRSDDDVRQAWHDIAWRVEAVVPSSSAAGVLVQRCEPPGVELLVGLTHDETFGPVLTVGAGGIDAETLADIALAPIPVDEDDARSLLRSLRIAPILAGSRGRQAVDLDSVARLIVIISDLAGACDGRLTELDLNPVIARPDGCVVVDYLVTLRDPSATPGAT